MVTTETASDEEVAHLKTVYEPFQKGKQEFIRTNPGSVILPAAYEKFKDRIKNWVVRPDDIYVFAYAKNGTTWTQELVWLVQNDCNFETAKSVHLHKRVPFIEIPILLDFMKEEITSLMETDLFTMLEMMPSPRMLKSHLRFCLLPDDLLDKSKVVLCMRNPKDTVVSYYHHEKLIKAHGYLGDFPTYFNLFMDNLVIYGSYFDYITEAWQRRNHPNLCLLFYEDMKKDLEANVKKVAKFLGKELTDEKVDVLVDHLSFKTMKNNKAVNNEEAKERNMFNKDGNFMRKGEVGDWKNYFTDEMNKRMDEAIEKHFKPIGLEFKYE